MHFSNLSCLLFRKVLGRKIIQKLVKRLYASFAWMRTSLISNVVKKIYS